MGKKIKVDKNMTYNRRRDQILALKSKYNWWVYEYCRGILAGSKNG